MAEEPEIVTKRHESSEPEQYKKAEALTALSIEENEEPVPHLHAKTFLIVFAVCLIYFA